MQKYIDLLKQIQSKGEHRDDRTGTGTISLFGVHLRFDLREGFPLLTTKKIHTRSVIHELLWFLKGESNIAYLKENNVRIWDEWADEDGDLGPVYGVQWRLWKTENLSKQTHQLAPSIDQMAEVVEQIKTNPYSRRHIVSAWNVGQLSSMRLPPCHLLFQFYVSENRYLSCQLYQRSCDTFLGLPFNIASYSLLTHMVAQQCNLEPKEFIWCGGDVHIYKNHLAQVEKQISRKPYPLPKLHIRRRPKDLFSYKFEDFVFENYQCHPTIKADISV